MHTPVRPVRMNLNLIGNFVVSSPDWFRITDNYYLKTDPEGYLLQQAFLLEPKELDGVENWFLLGRGGFWRERLGLFGRPPRMKGSLANEKG